MSTGPLTTWNFLEKKKRKEEGQKEMPVLEVGKAEFFQAEVHCYLLSEALETSQSYHYPSLPLKIPLRGSTLTKASGAQQSFARCSLEKELKQTRYKPVLPFDLWGLGEGGLQTARKGRAYIRPSAKSQHSVLA